MKIRCSKCGNLFGITQDRLDKIFKKFESMPGGFRDNYVCRSCRSNGVVKVQKPVVVEQDNYTPHTTDMDEDVRKFMNGEFV